MIRFEPRTTTSATNVLALLANALDDEYEANIVAGAIAGAREANATILCITGGSIDDSVPERAARNFVFDLVGSRNVSGILVISSAVGSALGPNRLKTWFERYSGVPLVSIGIPIEGYPSVQVDNAFGARAAVTHLIRDHGKRRIAYIRGPRGSTEADVRVEAYRSALELEQIELDPRWIVDGDFTRPSGHRAVGILFDERGIKPDSLDAIAAANDYMALAAIEELGKRGLRVPENLAVVGFDDVDSARLARPALTTVRQPTEMLGRSAARALANRIAHRPVEESGLLPTELVPRTSCGCSSSFALGVSLNVSQNAGRGLQASFVTRRQIIIAEVARAARGRLGAAGAGWETRLIDALLNELRGARASFMREFEKVLRQVERTRPDGDLIQEVLSGLRLQSLPCVAQDPIARDRLEEALHDARVFASAFGSEAVASRTRHERDRTHAFQRALRAAMISSATEVSRACAAALPEFGIEACVVAALTKPGDVKSEARAVIGFGPGGKLATSEPIALDALPSHELLERSGRTLMLVPILHRSQPLGAALISVVTLDAMFIEDLRDAFSAVLMVRSMKAGAG
jgi:sigma-B regulation protein RsbU (phosphoserine phosphatase)